MKKLYYKLFVAEIGKTEKFFLVCVLSAFAFHPNHFAGAAAAFCAPLFFIRKKSGVVIAALVLALNLFAANCLLVTGVKEEGSKNLYTTTGGTLVTAQKLLPGDIVTGGFEMRTYAGAVGRFAGGYFMANSDGAVFHLPLVGALLEYRQHISDRLFSSTGGRLRLTQAIVLGDKNYLQDDVTDKYYLTGLGHLLAVSGLHIGLYGMVCFFLFSFLPGKFRLVPAVVMFVILIPFTGFKIPVMRAGLIGISYGTAKFFDYGTDFKKLLLFFAGLFMLVSPSMIADPSFLLSFSAVYGLMHLNQLRLKEWMLPFAVGLVSTAFIIPAVSAAFGSFNISSALSTPFLIPVLSFQVIAFLVYLAAPSISLAPLILLEKIHLWLVGFFADHLGFMFTLYKTEIFWSLMMVLFLYVCVRLRIVWMTFCLLIIPYLPSNLPAGGYFPNMGASKGFVVKDEKTHIFYKGSHGDFLYRFIPYLAELGVKRADTGSINIYGSENIFIPIEEPSGGYGWTCVNGVDESCKAVYHTRSDTYACDDAMVHILYKNKCRTDKTYLLSETGDLILEDNGE